MFHYFHSPSLFVMGTSNAWLARLRDAELEAIDLTPCYTLDIYGQLRTFRCADIQEDTGMTCEVDEVFFADCAARSFFDQVANKWSVMILTLLTRKPTRFNEIKRRLEGITHKALTQALRRLERNGLIARAVLNTSPVAVEYSITELGRTLQVPFGAVYAWSIKHLHEIDQAQKTYDQHALPAQ
ncbi:helix-turn-helix domain-containing protein [Paraburkholderia sediminicola]|uniref:winged helix-turn-helix transcriptional regulator n=1 Tax=Paraburkholderia sediminicola TaxID=458836 RepID=UPI0038BD00F4